ncbi:hypothetical protein AB1Y20_009728 [Prymnesium parvum]|uniref:Uncharacterized protein n=1 Tax=Prymnesium parvum TaxID=97485 RepID=A0AB34K5C5_PRYPA
MPAEMLNSLAAKNSLQNALLATWGAHDIKGLDPKRATAIGLEPAIKIVGHATSTQKLPAHLEHPGTLARFLRRTAELLLQHSKKWLDIEVNTRETNKHYQKILVMTRVQEEAYRTAAEILYKIYERPGLLSVWEHSCPNLLRSKRRELELQTEGTAEYLSTLKELTRIELIYDAVAALKTIENDRPIKPHDVKLKYDAVRALAQAEQEKIHAQEKALKKELEDAGDGSETILNFEKLLAVSISTDALILRHQEILSLPKEIITMRHIELLDLSHNEIEVLPAEIYKLKVLKKLYLDHNKLTTLPCTLHQLSETLILLGVAENPLEDTLMQQYLCGLPVLLAYLKATQPRRSKRTSPSSEDGPSPDNKIDLFSTDLPGYASD